MEHFLLLHQILPYGKAMLLHPPPKHLSSMLPTTNQAIVCGNHALPFSVPNALSPSLQVSSTLLGCPYDSLCMIHKNSKEIIWIELFHHRRYSYYYTILTEYANEDSVQNLLKGGVYTLGSPDHQKPFSNFGLYSCVSSNIWATLCKI